MNAQIEQADAPENNPAQITLLKIREWGACSDGRDWFREKFPQGGAYGEVMNSLYADKRYGDARWLADKAFDVKNINADFIKSDVRLIVAATEGVDVDESYGARIGSSGDDARIGSSGYGAQIGSSGDGARIGSSGDDARIGSSGYGAQIGSSGYGAQIGSSGDDARIGSSGDGARIGSSGDDARIVCSGENVTVAFSGRRGSVSLGKGGAASLVWHDGTRNRFINIYEGEDGIEAGVLYSIKNGKVVRQ
ncbi:hypothetical protein [Komagataeibacter sp. FNDCF1]|uniref:hypothetical protein n=1 Tax=Komagataeibacter sp. FNDCF1 TaxID=2878681 RepID=UPI001E40053D|nr:hypothetical protein [Komagataeibacter sp. FNDCF1]MCE2563350.1 hypothetical protein [Komagataeibacter sp. FNDCF1]